MRYLKFLTLTTLLAGSQMALEAKVTLPHLISSGMVVQRNQPVKLWGKADPSEAVNVKVAKGKSASTVADADGNWSVSLPALKAGGPYTITINDITLDNVMSGDVLLCSGQSNMELPVRRVTDMFAEEIASYDNPNIRHFRVPNVFEFHGPKDDVDGSWKELTQENVMNFSALGYFISKALYEETGVPVGIINSSWGGTPVEAWISEEYLAPYPRAINEKRLYEDDGYRDRIKKLEGENYARWNNVLYLGDPGLHGAVKWMEPDFDDSSWVEVDLISGNSVTDGTVTGDDLHNAWRGAQWATDGLNPVNGSHWFRKNINLTAEQASKPGVLRLGCIVDADSVYVNGVFVGTTSYQYPPRIYNVPAGVLKEGKNNVTVRLFSQNGQGHFVAEKPYCLILGDERIDLTGNWRYNRGAAMTPGPGMEFYCYKPTVLYNAMIHPLINVPVSGVVWYQGESNVSRRNEYASLLETMMANWRDSMNNPELPFYIVELADFLHSSDKRGRASWAEMRKQQAKAAEDTPNAYLIPNSDLGEWNDIHPLDKKTLGNRVVKAVIAHDPTIVNNKKKK